MASLRSRLSGVAGIAILGLVVIALAMIAGIVYMLNRQASGIVNAFRPRVDSEVVLRGTIRSMQAEGKLVVLTADVTAISESSTDKRIFFDLIDAGTTTVRARAPARVQYVIQLDDISRDDFLYDPDTKRILLALPNPQLDTTIVQVSTDPSEVEIERSVGWLRLEVLSGRYNEERARRLLREAAIEAGYSGRWLPRAQQSARQEIRRLLEPLIQALDEDVTFSIAFVDPSEIEAPEALPTPTP